MTVPSEHHGHAPPLGQLDLRFGSNAVRLGLREWLAVGAVLAAIFILTPMVWQRVEPLPAPADTVRLPYRLSGDYWQFSRYAAQAVDAGCTPVLGDSVVWGEYVTPDQTLTYYLNRQAGGERFANLGVDGTYPAALAGLVEYYGGAVRGRRVILHCNLLWMASPRHDLRDAKAGPPNHPALLPQFGAEIKGYDETVSRRIGIAVGRHVPFMQWTEHLKLAYYGGQDMPAWTLEHPYDNPLATIRPSTVGADDPPRHEAVPWTKQGIEQQAFPWMDLGESVQWRFFRRTVETLQARGNRVFIVVGPFNEHMLTPESLAAYRRLQGQVEGWLKANQIPYVAPPALPSELYADASHPLAAGYEALAHEVLEAYENP